MKKILLLLVPILLLFLCGCSEEIYIHCNCAKVIADMQLSGIQTDTTESDTTNAVTETQSITTEQNIDTTPVMSEALTEEIERAKNELKDKGWKNIDVIEGHHHYFNKWAYMDDLAGVYEIGYNYTLYSVFGTTEIIPVYFETDSTISVIISIVCDNVTGDTQRIDVYYASSYGRNLDGVYLRSWAKKFSKGYQDVCYADDSDLQYYFHPEPTPHV